MSEMTSTVDRVLIPAVERGAWEDLRLLVQSLRFYMADVPVTVAWKGARPPDIDVAECVQQPADCRHFGDACRFLLASTGDAEGLLFLNDDTVITPRTEQYLREDLTLLDRARRRVGLVGLRSNSAVGAQNIRRGTRPFSGIHFEDEFKVWRIREVCGVAFWVQRSALEQVPQDWTRVHWHSDNLLSWDLHQAGFEHLVSRAYVHHVGSNSATWAAWDAEAREWLERQRPDYARMKGWLD